MLKKVSFYQYLRFKLYKEVKILSANDCEALVLITSKNK